MAGRIPQTFIDDLLHRVDIVDVVDSRLALKKTGKNYSACCPFHNEKTPSFSVQPEKQFYYCFGCGIGGNAIGFVMEFDQLSFPEAVESLAGTAGVEVPREESKEQIRRQSEHAKLQQCVERASDFYKHQLRSHEAKQAAVDYLKARGVSGEIARDFNIGYAPPGWNNLLTELGSNAAEQTTLLKAGLIIQKENKSDDKKAAGASAANQDRFYDRFRHRIMFPIRDSRGRSIAFGGRVLGDDKPKYLNSPETEIFHKGSQLYGLYEANKTRGKLERILIVEGYMDVIALAQMGIRNAVATLGTATSAVHLQRVFKIVSEVVFCFDGDDAGRTAAWRALEATLPLMEDGRQVKFLFLPEGEDPDSVVRKIGEAKFNSQIDKAVPLENFFFEKLSQGLDIKSIEGKARLSKIAKPLLVRLPQGVYGQLMLDRLSATLGVESSSLKQLIESEPKPEPPAPTPMPAPSPAEFPHMPDYDIPQSDNEYQPRQSSQSRPNTGGGLAVYRKPAALKAVELLLSNPEMANSIKQDLGPLRSAEDENRKLLLSLIDLVQKEPDTDANTMLGYCYDTKLRAQLTQIYVGERITPTEGLEAEFNQILDNILSDIRHTLQSVQMKAKLAGHLSGKSAAATDLIEPSEDSSDL